MRSALLSPASVRTPAPLLAAALLCATELGALGAAQEEEGVPALDVERVEDGSEHAFVEVLADRASVYAGELLAIRLRFGVEAAFLEESLIQLFRQPLDVPVQAHAAWLGELDCLTRVDAPSEPVRASVERARFALDAAVSEAVRQTDDLRDGRRFRVFEHVSRVRLDCPGAFTLPAPTLRFAYATRFEEDVFSGRVPVDRRDAFVSGSPLELTVLGLPEEGRPPDFHGGIGRFELRAVAEPRTLAAGESLELALTVSGEGDLAAIEAPRLDGLAGFRLTGRLERTGAASRTFVYALERTTAPVDALGAIELSTFDPGPPGAYRTLRTEPIPIVTRAPEEKAPPGPEASTRAWQPLVLGSLALVLLAVLLFAGLLRARRRARAASEDSCAGRASAAAELYALTLALHEEEPAEAFAAFLAALLSGSPSTAHAPDLGARLHAAGIPEALARRTAAHAQSLHAERYGGAAHANARADTNQLVAELRDALARGRPVGPKDRDA